MPGEDERLGSSSWPGPTRELTTRSVRTRARSPSVLARPVARPAPPPPPPRIGRFRPIEVLGRGGMGVVYRAMDPQLGRTVALKLLEMNRDDPDAQQRMRREAQALARLSHPHVVQVFDSGIFRGRVYIAMELVPGPTLRVWQAHESRTIEALVDAYAQAAEGLAAAHAEGLIHRDFKPDNAIMGDDGRVRVLDFGLVRATAPLGTPTGASAVHDEPGGTLASSLLAAPLTDAGTVMGTPAYMAPELQLGRPASAASDQFALCVSLYEAAYRARPFAGPRIVDLVDHMLRGELRPVPDRSAVPQWLRAILLRGLRPDPVDRWPSMDALQAELRRGAPRPLRRLMPVATALGVAAIVGLGIARSNGAAAHCNDAHGRLDGVWDEDRREAVQRSLMLSGAPYAASTWGRVETRLDDYAERWHDTHDEACRGALNDDVLDLRMACLERRRQGLASLVDVLIEGDASVLPRAASSVDGLGDLARCLAEDDPHATLPQPRDAAQAQEIRSIREQLARIVAERSAGRYDVAAEQSERARAAAESLGYAPVIAEAALQDGLAHYQAGDHDTAQASLEHAYFVASALGYQEVVGDAASWLVYVTGVGRGDPVAGARWAEHARAASEGRDDDAEVRYLVGLGTISREVGELDRARTLLEQALSIQERTLEPTDLRLTGTIQQLGLVLSLQDLHDEALELHERALALLEQAVGPAHPKLAAAYDFRAVALDNQGDHEGSLRDHRRSLAIWEAALGPDHPEVSVAVANLGIVLVELGRPQEALEHYHRALASWEKSVGPDHPRVASLHLNIGNALSDLGLRREAIASYRRALELRELRLGANHPQTLIARELLEDME